MSNKTIYLNDALYEYLLGASLREPDVLRRLREETRPMPEADCQISPEQGQFMGLLLRVMGAKRALEVGTFTGYSSLAMALALPEDGKVITCDRSEEWTDIARRYWKKAGVERRIELRLGEALNFAQQFSGIDGAGSEERTIHDIQGNHIRHHACVQVNCRHRSQLTPSGGGGEEDDFRRHLGG